jgi:integrase
MRTGIAEGPIFRSVRKSGEVSATHLSAQSVSIILRASAERAGLKCVDFSAHSLRAGLVTSAAKAGVSSWKIRQQTGHRSDAMLQKYIRDAEIFVSNAAGAVL